MQGFDIVNKLQDNSDSDSDDDDDDKNANIDLSKDISDALKNYERYGIMLLRATRTKQLSCIRR